MAAEPKAPRPSAGDPRSPGPAPPSSTRPWWVALLVVLAVSAGLRFAAAQGELWLDEVWTISLVDQFVESPTDVIYRLRHDNNHFVNSWVAHALRPDAPMWQFRAPAVIAGIAAVCLAAWARWRLGPSTAFAAATLIGISYLSVHYSSEARGYAFLMCFTALAFGALQRSGETTRVRWEVLVAASCILGFLAHPLFLVTYLAVQVWSWLPDGQPTTSASARRLAIAALFRTLLPGMFFAWLYWVNLRGMQIGGGDTQPYSAIVLQTLSLACGGSFGSPGNYMAAAASAALTGASLIYVCRTAPRRAAFYLTAIVLAPAVILFVAPRGDIYPRYFLVSVLFLYFLWSEMLGSIGTRFRFGWAAYAMILVAFAAANLRHDVRLLALKRGHYREAIALIQQETFGPSANVTSDHGFRHRQMLEFFSRRIPSVRPIHYVPAGPHAGAAAEWLLTHNLDPNAVAPEALRLDGAYDFKLVKSYPFAGLSGWQLNVYRKLADTPHRIAARIEPASGSATTGSGS